MAIPVLPFTNPLDWLARAYAAQDGPAKAAGIFMEGMKQGREKRMDETRKKFLDTQTALEGAKLEEANQKLDLMQLETHDMLLRKKKATQAAALRSNALVRGFDEGSLLDWTRFTEDNPEFAGEAEDQQMLTLFTKAEDRRMAAQELRDRLQTQRDVAAIRETGEVINPEDALEEPEMVEREGVPFYRGQRNAPWKLVPGAAQDRTQQEMDAIALREALKAPNVPFRSPEEVDAVILKMQQIKARMQNQAPPPPFNPLPGETNAAPVPGPAGDRWGPSTQTYRRPDGTTKTYKVFPTQ